MIVAIGTDILEIDRLERAVSENGDAFLERVFTAAERKEASRRGNAAISC